MAITDAVLDELIKDYQEPEDLIGKNGILKRLTKALVERAMGAEMSEHLGYDKHDSAGNNSGNSRNGTSTKTIQGEFGKATIEVPRDRNGSFEPQIVPKGERRFAGFDKKIISMYARGMTTRDIEEHLKDIYGVDVSAQLISKVTEEVMDEVRAWQSRPLDTVYPIVYFDALFVKIREGAHIQNKAIYLALGVNMEGNKELLGLWIAQTEGAKFWLQVFTELRNRGVKDIFIACMDGLKGVPEAIAGVFCRTVVQLCVVHMIRNSMSYVSWKDRKPVARDLRAIYTASTLAEAEMALLQFAETWDAKYPSVSQSWQRNWDHVTPFLAYPADIRKAIYTTNAIESMNRSLRKITKTRGAFPNDEAATKLLYLAIHNAAKKWTMPIPNWKAALNQFAILFGERMPDRTGEMEQQPVMEESQAKTRAQRGKA